MNYSVRCFKGDNPQQNIKEKNNHKQAYSVSKQQNVNGTHIIASVCNTECQKFAWIFSFSTKSKEKVTREKLMRFGSDSYTALFHN